jgi:hypothetical protein
MPFTKNRLLAFGALLAALLACSPPRLVPVAEISPPLTQEEVFAWDGQVAGHVLFPCREGIGWVDAAGRIVTWNPEKKAGGDTWPLPFAVSDPPFRQGDFLALKSRTEDHWLVFDLARMETRFDLRDLQARQILGVDGDHLVYIDGETLVVHGRLGPAGFFRWPIAEKKFFNCHFSREHILIMSDRHLFVFRKRDGKFQPLPLPLEAAAGFLCQGEFIYYGSRQRQLVKYSWPENRLAWKLKLGQNLEQQPFISGNAIIIAPADNNVLRVSNSGSVRWWLALRSIPQFDLLPMADHLAAFLLNGEISFIDFRRRGETVFRMNGRPAGMPLAYGHDLYFFLAAGEEQRLQRVGSRYGLELTMDPERALWLGEAIRFYILLHNLLGPKLRVVISDAEGQALLAKDFGAAERAELVWMPPRAGVYRLQASAAAHNRGDEKELSFQVFDAREIFLNLYLFFL